MRARAAFQARRPAIQAPACRAHVTESCELAARPRPDGAGTACSAARRLRRPFHEIFESEGQTMSDKKAAARADGGRDYSETLFLPKTDFPMRAGLPQKEPEILARWEAIQLFRRQRDEARGREKYILHDGPPYANGHIHIGTGLNKILKDVVAR